MAKTITIDETAYEILRSHKFAGESFSDVIKKSMALALTGKELDDYLAKLIAAEGPNHEEPTGGR